MIWIDMGIEWKRTNIVSLNIKDLTINNGGVSFGA